MLQEFDEAAWTIAEAGLDETPWTELRGRVVELIRRGTHTLTVAEGTASDGWGATPWAETDAPVVLARAFGMVHRRLAARAGDRRLTAVDAPRRRRAPALTAVGGGARAVPA